MTAAVCVYCEQKQPHPYFVTLLENVPDANERGGQVISSCISVSRNPCKRLLEYNDCSQPQGSTATRRKRKRGAPNWVSVCSVGPFVDNNSSVFRSDWTRLSRKVSGRLVWAVINCQNAAKYGSNLRVYLRDQYRSLLEKQLPKTPTGRLFLASLESKSKDPN
jgi:hypothetical protein